MKVQQRMGCHCPEVHQDCHHGDDYCDLDFHQDDDNGDYHYPDCHQDDDYDDDFFLYDNPDLYDNDDFRNSDCHDGDDDFLTNLGLPKNQP